MGEGSSSDGRCARNRRMIASPHLVVVERRRPLAVDAHADLIADVVRVAAAVADVVGRRAAAEVVERRSRGDEREMGGRWGGDEDDSVERSYGRLYWRPLGGRAEMGSSGGDRLSPAKVVECGQVGRPHLINAVRVERRGAAAGAVAAEKLEGIARVGREGSARGARTLLVARARAWHRRRWRGRRPWRLGRRRRLGVVRAARAAVAAPWRLAQQ